MAVGSQIEVRAIPQHPARLSRPARRNSKMRGMQMKIIKNRIEHLDFGLLGVICAWSLILVLVVAGAIHIGSTPLRRRRFPILSARQPTSIPSLLLSKSGKPKTAAIFRLRWCAAGGSVLVSPSIALVGRYRAARCVVHSMAKAFLKLYY